MAIFCVDGSINQQPVRFMVDTGASWIAIPEKLKAALRLTRGGYVQVSTASGIVGNYETQIDDLTVGPLKFRNVQGALNPYAPNDTVLLGMSALKDVELVQQRGRMILRQQNQTEEQVQVQHIEPEQSAAPVVLRRSLQECMGPDKRVDQATLNCLEGQ
jgi:clan AA aspartic protease (TIGR02281 family)